MDFVRYVLFKEKCEEAKILIYMSEFLLSRKLESENLYCCIICNEIIEEIPNLFADLSALRPGPLILCKHL